MQVNIPAKGRIAIYVVTALLSPVVAYLNAHGIIGALEVALWSAEVTAAGALAALNVGNKENK